MNIEMVSFKKKASGDFEVQLLGQTLVTVSKLRLLKLLSLYLTKEDLKTIHRLTEGDGSIDTQDIRIQELVRVYFSHKRAFFGNRKLSISDVKRGSAHYKAFSKALEIIDTNAVSYEQFMQAQVEGLAFANVFPKPSQLCTEDAETRLLQSVATPKSKKEVRLVRLSPDDYNLALSKNAKFQGVYGRFVKNESLSLEELIYCRDVIVARGKNVPDSISQQIEKLKEA